MKLSDTEKITLKEAKDVLSAENDPKQVKHLINREKQRTPVERIDSLINDSKKDNVLVIKNGNVEPPQLARWAKRKELALPLALSDLLHDYEPPDPDLAGYMKTDKIERLIVTLRMLDKGDGTAEEGTTGQAIIKEQYPAMSDSMLSEALRVFRHILLK